MIGSGDMSGKCFLLRDAFHRHYVRQGRARNLYLDFHHPSTGRESDISQSHSSWLMASLISKLRGNDSTETKVSYY